MTPILSLTFEPPSITPRRGAWGWCAGGSSTSTSRFEQAAGGADGRVRGRAHDRRVRPVGRAEGVVDVERPRPRRAWPRRRGRRRSSPASKRRFSSSSTPGASSARRGPAPGPSSTLGSGLPLGRPRWLHAHDRRPLALHAARSMVGSAARMRRSSVIRPSPSSGTLKSVRTRTRLALSDVAEVLQAWGCSSRCRRRGRPPQARWASADDHREVDQAVRVAPLVVVPAEHLDQVAHGHGEPAVERAGGRRADDVGRDDGLVGEDQDLGERPESAAALKASLISSTVTSCLRTPTKSVIEPVGAGTRSEVPSSLPSWPPAPGPWPERRRWRSG